MTKIRKDHFILDQPTARSIVGISKDLLPINFLVEGAKVQPAIAKVLVEYITEKGEKKGPEPGTGFMVSHDLLMTNHHVIPHATSDAPAIHHRTNEKIIKVSVCDAKFNYQKDWKDNELPVVDRKCDLSTMVSNEQLDYTIIKVDNSPGRELGFVKLDYKIDVKEGEQVCIIQHPGGRYKEISWSNKNRIQSDSTKKNNLPASIILYDADTEGGSSGSPVFNMAWDLIALHHKDRKEVDKNEGIRIKDIINDLLKNFPQMHPSMKSYIQAALIDANLPSDSKSVLDMENLVKPGFFESVGLNTEEQISGLKKILVSQKSTDFIDLASWNIGWLRSEKENNYLVDYVRTADYIHLMAIDVWVLFGVSGHHQLSILAKTLETLYNDKYDYVGEENASIQYPYVFYDSSKVQCEVKDLQALLSMKGDEIEPIDIKPLCFYTKIKGVSGKIFESNIVIFNLREVDDHHATISHAKLYERLYQKNEKNWVIVTYWNNQTKISLDTISNNHNKLVLTETAGSDDNIDNSKERSVVSYTLNLKSPVDHIVVSNNTRIQNTDQSIKVIPYDKSAPKFLPNNPTSDHASIPIVTRFIYG